MGLKVLYFCLLLGYVNAYVDLRGPEINNVLDHNLFEEVLDSELCREQLVYIANNSMIAARFQDAGIRTPRGIFDGNLVDLGNYHQCLQINERFQNNPIQGKYCVIDVPLSQPDFELPSPDWPEWPPEWPEFPWPEFNQSTSRISKETLKILEEYNKRKRSAERWLGTSNDHNRVAGDSAFTGMQFKLAVCIPKTCTTQEALNTLLVNTTALGLRYEDDFCRLPNDKPWVAGDYVATCIFSFIGLLTLLSTYYDVRHTIFLKKNPKLMNPLYSSFSLYTNTRRLVTYTPRSGSIECLDGIRALAMTWVIIGHTFVTQLTGLAANPLDIMQWITTVPSLWITMGPITVDTFFMLSGLLIVYTTAGKLTRSKLIKNLHLFYLNRLLRMFPALAAAILLQISVFNRATDGPYWETPILNTERCRNFWWSTLLHIQNYLNPREMCLNHTWYLAIDVQLHIISPLVLFWVLSNRKLVAWSALTLALLASLTSATVYNFLHEFSSGPVIPSRLADTDYFLTYYYINTLTRASPFFVGLIYGYILHKNRGKTLRLSKLLVTGLWIMFIVIMSVITYVSYLIMQFDWDNQTVDSLVNSFMRPLWATAVGFLIFACVHGYAGPINWLLSLRMWKLLSRLSYAMYLVHYPMIFVVNGAQIAPTYFTVHFSLFKFMADYSLAVFVAFLVTVFVDSPCTTLIKLAMGGKKRPKDAEKNTVVENIDGANNPAFEGDEIKAKI